MKIIYKYSRFIAYWLTFQLSRIADKKNKLVVLCYHDISNSSYEHALSKERFIWQIEYLLKTGYEFVDLNYVEKVIKGKENVVGKKVLVTFDDGYKSVKNVKNYLNEKRIKPVIFVLSGRKINRKDIDNNLKLLNIEQIAELIKIGWEIGSHGVTHTNFKDLESDEVESEICNSKKQLEKVLETKVRAFSYPHGFFTDEAIDDVQGAGYKFAFSMNDGIIERGIDKYAICRIGIVNSHSKIEFMSTITWPTILLRKIIRKFR